MEPSAVLMQTQPGGTPSGWARLQMLALPALACVFAVAVLWQIPTHEIWRDEWHPWLVARNSGSLGELLWNKRYDGHPGLWYFLVFALTRLTPDPAAMQWLNAAIAILAGWLILRFAPFSVAERALCLCGYYILYEYAVIARNYSLCVLLVVAFCAALRRQPDRTRLPAILLALLAWSHALGTILALVLGGWWLTLGAPEPRPRAWRRVAAAVCVAIAVATAMADESPPADGGVGRWRFDFVPQRLVSALGAFANGLLPLPGWGAFDWNTHLLDPSPLTKAAVGLALAGLAAFAVGGSRRPLLLWAAMTGGLLAFFYLRFGGTYRHHGFLWLATLAAIWLGRAAEPAGALSRYRCAAFAVLLALQVPAAVTATIGDRRQVFSSSLEAAATIRSLGVADLPLVGEPDVTTVGVAGALGRPIYLQRGERSPGFVIFDRARRANPTDAELLSSAQAIAARAGSNVLLILGRQLKHGRRNVQRLATVPSGIVKDEVFILYRVLRNPPPRRERQPRKTAPRQPQSPAGADT